MGYPGTCNYTCMPTVLTSGNSVSSCRLLSLYLQLSSHAYPVKWEILVASLMVTCPLTLELLLGSPDTWRCCMMPISPPCLHSVLHLSGTLSIVLDGLSQVFELIQPHYLCFLHLHCYTCLLVFYKYRNNIMTTCVIPWWSAFCCQHTPDPLRHGLH